MRVVAPLLFAVVVLGATAKLRAPEYDEAYSIFLTAGDPRPPWPTGVFHAGDVRGLYRADASLGQIARYLRTGDVHPPLYFWTLEYWRRLAGPSWFAARLLSVLFSIGALAALAWLAALAEVPVPAAMLIALLSYGFAYTGVVARGFALAQLLNIVGAAMIFSGIRDRKRFPALCGGFVLGAAGFSNYLAIFVGLAALCWLLLRRDGRKFFVPAVTGFAFWMPWIAYFFLPQRNSRIGQFKAFSPSHAMALLAKDSGAALFGGLPVYAGQAGPFVTFALALLFAICLGFIVKRWCPGLLLFAIAALAMPVGLLALGFIFDNTPIEIRYLAFSIPFLALLVAKTLPKGWLYLLLVAETCGTIGLAIAPQYHATARSGSVPDNCDFHPSHAGIAAVWQ